MLSYGPNWAMELKRSANYIARILDGAKPADIPVESVQNFEMLVNLRTARALGISVPSSVLAQAAEVVK